MKRSTLLGFAFLAPVLTAGGDLLASPPPPPQAPPISGVVRSVETPVSGALVIFYNLADASLTRARTAADGTFVLASAPIGVYDLIAYKRGFVPALVRLWHQASAPSLSSVSIELAAAGKAVRGKTAPDIWELRDRLPSDVLREINMADSEEHAAAASPVREHMSAKMGGEVRTVKDVAPGDSSLARATVGVRGGLSNGWSYALQGDYATLSDGRTTADPGTTTGNSTGLALDVATSALDHVRVTTRRNQVSFGDQGPATLQAHQVMWNRGDEQGTVESVAARYIEEAGLYRATARGTTLFPIASRTWELNAAYSRAATDTPGVSVAMTYRRREGTGASSGVATNGTLFGASPDADLAAGTSVRLGSKATVEGGVLARYLAGGYGIAPRAVARYELTDGTFVFVRGLYRVVSSDTSAGAVLPRVASIDDPNEAASRHSVSAGLEHKGDEGASIRIQATQQRMDEVVRAFFDGDLLTDFDSVYLMSGNTVRTLDASGQHRLTQTLAGSVTMRYGTIDGDVKADTAGAYGILDSKGRFWTGRAGIELLPTKTGVALIVRGVRQRLQTPSASLRNDSDKVAISLAQDLSVIGLTPFGSICRLLVALESSRNSNLSEKKDEAPINRRLMTGVAVSF
jgi:hypothetical protein